MNVEVKKFVEIFGVSESEAKIYLAGVQTGPALIAKIADVAQIPRTAAYSPIKSLIKKGFIGMTNRRKRKYYVAVSPKQLPKILEQRQDDLSSLISSLAPKETISSQNNDLDITYFVGNEGIKTAGLLFLDETIEKKWYSFENVANLAELIGTDFEEMYVKKRIERNIKSYMILSTEYVSKWVEDLIKKDTEQLRETITLSNHAFPFKATIGVTKGITLIINPNQNPFAVIIRNPNIAHTLISIHKNIWERYKVK